MKHRCYLPALLFALSLALPATSSAQAIAKAMGNLRWGMSEVEVKRVVKARIADSYAKQMKKAKGAAKAALEKEMLSKQKAIDSGYFEFTGKSSRFDRSPIAGEFTYGNDEAVLAASDGDSESYYFFIGGNLWKWVKHYPASSFGGGNFGKFESAVNKRFGKSYKKTAAIYPTTDQSYTFLERLDRQSRLRAVDRTSDQGGYSLVFEEMDTVRSLSALRPNMPKMKRSARVAKAEEDDDSEPSSVSPVASKSDRPSSSGKRSVFASEQEDESEEDYEARKKQVLAEKKQQQERIYQRKEEIKKGKALDSLQGIDDDDPLAGMN